MKKFIADFGKTQQGMVLVYVTLVLVLAILVIPPILQFGFGAHRSAQIREDRLLKVYAADTGIEDAYFRIIAGNITDWDYTIPGVNGSDVHVKIEKKTGKGTYLITSTANNWDGTTTTIESQTGALNFNDFLYNVMSSQGDIKIAPGSYVYGNVTLNGKFVPKSSSSVILESGGNISNNVPDWPDPGELADHYWPQVESAGPIPYTSPLTLTEESITLGPGYIDGNLEIGGQGTVTLGGTLYVKGNLNVSGPVRLELNGHTIYVEVSVDKIFQEVTISGPGAIIAEIDVHFLPHQDSEEFIFVMSVDGRIKLNPQGSFFGSLAGIAEIEILAGYHLEWVPPPEDENGDPAINFPGGACTTVRVLYYIIRD
ncbi:MAG: hypothetical protein IBX68_10505 [Dehalococcoidia bacterium]|nr:hypothetical protein [Dehalococcoidia bacterium]